MKQASEHTLKVAAIWLDEQNFHLTPENVVDVVDWPGMTPANRRLWANQFGVDVDILDALPREDLSLMDKELVTQLANLRRRSRTHVTTSSGEHPVADIIR